MVDVYEVVKKLIGPIDAVGESNTDEKRLANLKEMISLAELLISDISDVARHNINRHEHSMKTIGKEAHDFLKAHGIEY